MKKKLIAWHHARFILAFLFFMPACFLVAQNNSPVAQDDYFALVINTSVNGNLSLNDSDPDGNNLTYNTALIVNPSSGVIVVSPNGVFTYTPNTGYGGKDMFIYQVCDNGTPSFCTIGIAHLNVIDTVNSFGISSVNVTDVSSCGLTDGSIAIQTLPVSNSIEYSIDGGVTFASNGGVFNNLAAGNYSIVTRKIGTTDIDNFSINPVEVKGNMPVMTNVTSTNPSNCGLSDGSITITATGTGVLEYSIDGGTTWQLSNVFSLLTGGTYNVAVRNVSGTCATFYSATPVVLAASAAPVIANVASTNPTNCGLSDGTITVSASGAGALEYSIDGGATWQLSNVFAFLANGSYNVAVRNANGTCVTLFTATPVVLTASAAPVITNVASTNPTNCGLSDGTITVNASGAGALEYSIDGGLTWLTSNVFTGLTCGTYFIAVQNSNGSCLVNYGQLILSQSTTIAIGANQAICFNPNLSGTTITTTMLSPSAIAVLDSTNNACAYLYADNYGQDTLFFQMCDNLGACDTAILYLTVTDGVWPGDTDDDTDVNNFDLLNIGLGYGATGTPRNNPSTVWNGYVTPLWNVATPISNVDYRHLDANGDGIINASDTVAILQNYGLSYQRSGGGGNGAPLYIDTTGNKTPPRFSLPIMLGDAAFPAVDIHGGAFSILYDTAYIEKNSVFISFDTSWIGTNNSDMISINKNFGNQKQIDLAFTRIDGVNVTGFGQIGKLNFTIKDDILRQGFTMDSITLSFQIVNTKFISANEQLVIVSPNNTNWLITKTQSVPQVNLDGLISVFPNPANQFVQIESPALSIEKITITDMMGRMVYHNANMLKNKTTLEVSHLPKGVYSLQFYTAKGVVVKQLMIM